MNEDRRFLDEAGLARYDARIKEYIADQQPLNARYDLTTPAGSADVTFMDGEWVDSTQCMRFRGLVEVAVPGKAEYTVTVTTAQADERCVLTVNGEAYNVRTGPGNTIFTVQAEDILSMDFSEYVWVRSISLVGKVHVPTCLSELENDAGYLSDGHVENETMHIKND